MTETFCKVWTVLALIYEILVAAVVVIANI
jgi:hypothetical protein